MDKIIISETEFLSKLIDYFERNRKRQGGWVGSQNKDVADSIKSLIIQLSRLEPKSSVSITKKGNNLVLELFIKSEK